jgi:hypothetical protein
MTVTTTTLEQNLAAHLGIAYSEAEISALAEHFQTYGFARIPGLVSAEVLQALTAEVRGALDEHGLRIDVEIPETGNTKRSMTTVSQKLIARSTTLVDQIYTSSVITGFLSRLAGEEVVECPWEHEKYVIIRQERVGDTHGWHWGDFPFTVIWLLEVPSPEVGGSLQTVAHTTWDKEDPQVARWLGEGEIHTWDFVTGDVYFLRSDTTLHRTIPLREDATRIILNTCWGSLATADKEQSHETMAAMFDVTDD